MNEIDETLYLTTNVQKSTVYFLFFSKNVLKISFFTLNITMDKISLYIDVMFFSSTYP